MKPSSYSVEKSNPIENVCSDEERKAFSHERTAEHLAHFTSQASTSFARIFHGKVSTTVCLEKSSYGFSAKNHFGHGGKLCRIFDAGQRKLQEWTNCCFLRESYSNLLDAYHFEQVLERMARDELGRLQEVHEDSNSCSSKFGSSRGKRKTFGLEKLGSLCQDVRMHVDRWKLINHHILSQPWLRVQLPALSDELFEVKHRFDSLKGKILFWLQNLVQYGLQVFACSNIEAIGMDVLERLWQGLEDYNRLSILVNKMFIKQTSSNNMAVHKTRELLFAERKSFVCASINFETTLSESNIKCMSLPLNKVLNTIVSERSKRLSKAVSLSLVSDSKQILLELNIVKVLPYEWEKRITVAQPCGESKVNGVVPRTHDLPSLGKTNSQLHTFLNEEEEMIEKLLVSCALTTSLIQQSGLERKMKMQMEIKPDSTSGVKTEGFRENENFSSSGNRDNDHGSILKTDASPKYSKKVQWKDPINPGIKSKLVSSYIESLWSHVDLNFFKQALYLPRQQCLTSHGVCGLPFMMDSLLMNLSDSVQELLTSAESLPASGHLSLGSISQHLATYAVQANLDTGFGQLLGIALADKCQQISTSSREPGTISAKLFVQNFTPLQCLFSVASQWTSDVSKTSGSSRRILPKLIIPSLQHLLALATFCLYWLQTKIHHFLAGWSLAPFLLLVQHDLKILLTTVKETLELAKLCTTMDSLSESELKKRMTLWRETDFIASQIQSLGKSSHQVFIDNLNTLSSEFWQEAFPNGKVWKKSRAAGSPCEPQPYVDIAIHHILQPVIMGVTGLKERLQQKIMSIAVEIMMESWSKHILTEEVRFSVYGAQQLQLDISHVKFWLSSKTSGLSIETQSVLTSLDVFEHLDGAVHLLLFQPKKKKMPMMDESDTEFESQISTVSGSSTLSGLSGDGYDLELLGDRIVPHREQWLDLRLRGGKTRKVLGRPFCLKTPDIK